MGICLEYFDCTWFLWRAELYGMLLFNTLRRRASCYFPKRCASVCTRCAKRAHQLWRITNYNLCRLAYMLNSRAHDRSDVFFLLQVQYYYLPSTEV
jgi:hypothetical protein